MARSKDIGKNVDGSVTTITLKKADWSFDEKTGKGRFPESKVDAHLKKGQTLKVKTYGVEPVEVTVSMTRNGEVLVKRIEDDTASTPAAATSSPASADANAGVDHAMSEASVESRDGDDADDLAVTDFVEATAPGGAKAKAPATRRSGDSVDSGDSRVYDAIPEGKFEVAAYNAARKTRLALGRLAENGSVALSRLVDKVKTAGYETRAAVQRSRRGWADRDVWNLGYVTLTRLSEMMEHLADTGYGYPADYEEDPSKWLVKHEGEDYEKWLHSHARTLGRITHDMDCGEADLNKAFNETVEEYGVGASAWMQDLDHASQVLKRYVDANSDVFNYWSKDVELYGREEADRRSKMLEEEFQRTWRWIGQWITGMWD